MKKDIFKRVGMLLASTAVCCGAVFGGLSMNGLRYVRPTAENWTLLAYMQPAARIEQQKTTRVIPEEKECLQQKKTWMHPELLMMSR